MSPMLSFLGLVPTFQKSKCKKLLNTTMERIKLLKSRREAQIRQLHMDIAQLRRLHKEQKAQVWLGLIWKEICLLSVYVKIADYCQFVQTNLKEIAEQRECPSYLEEPLAGLCFAASRCADLPELQELREIFVMKYGKDFVNSAQEPHEDCRINQEFLDDLCAKDPPDVRNKAVLEDIGAQERAVLDKNQEQEIHNSSSTEVSVDADECNQSQVQQEDIDNTDQAKDGKDEVGNGKLQAAEVMQETDHTVTVCDEDMCSVELANHKSTSEDRQSWRLKFIRALRRKLARQNKDTERKYNAKVHACVDKEGQGEENGNETGARLADAHDDGYDDCGSLQGEGTEPKAVNEDQLIMLYVEEPSFSMPPQRPPPPPPPPKRVPPLPSSL